MCYPQLYLKEYNKEFENTVVGNNSSDENNITPLVVVKTKPSSYVGMSKKSTFWAAKLSFAAINILSY